MPVFGQEKTWTAFRQRSESYIPIATYEPDPGAAGIRHSWGSVFHLFALHLPFPSLPSDPFPLSPVAHRFCADVVCRSICRNWAVCTPSWTPYYTPPRRH